MIDAYLNFDQKQKKGFGLREKISYLVKHFDVWGNWILTFYEELGLISGRKVKSLKEV